MTIQKIYELQLPYYKKGDDLHFHREREPDDQSAFLAHASALKHAARMLEVCAQHASKGLLKIQQADTHMIVIECEEALGVVLVAEEVLSKSPFEDEDEAREDLVDDTADDAD